MKNARGDRYYRSAEPAVEAGDDDTEVVVPLMVFDARAEAEKWF